MKIVILVFGKTDESYISEGIMQYQKRLKAFYPVEMEVINEPKGYGKWDVKKQKEEETKLFESKLTDSDEVILLDEKGMELTSEGFSKKVEMWMNAGKKRLVFIIAGPYGFSNEMIKKARHRISLSKMTFTHQMVRLIFIEQLYRAVTILKGLPYHHE
jgi:23S rRNA (pseudouridine1915-N3)-methyltransferase